MKPSVETEETKTLNDDETLMTRLPIRTINKHKQQMSNRGGINIEHLSGCIVLASLIIVSIVVYAFMWFMLIQDLLIPTIHNLFTTPFEWNVKYLSENIMIPFILVVFVIIMPFVIYIDLRNKRMKRKPTRNNKARR